MSASCPFEDMVAAHALDALDDEERAAFERHLAEGCPVCVPQLEEMRRVAEGIALSVPAVQPSEQVRQRLLARAATVTPFASRVERRRAPVRFWALAASVALVLLAGTVGWGLSLRHRLQGAERERAVLAADLAAARAQIGRGEIERVALLRRLAVVGASRLQEVQLASLRSPSAANGRMFVDPGSGEALFSASGLPALPKDRTYQLWFITGGKPVSAGTFDVGGRGLGQLLVERVPEAGRVDAWAVTIEPAGGVPQPTGEMVLKS
jgi:hypothetical protein